MSEIKIVEGEVFNDHRGEILSANNFSFEGVERFYTIKHTNTSLIRGWHGHQFEKKWFFCLTGSFTIAFVKIDNWENPSTNLVPEIFTLTGKESKIICLPEGYANCLKANEPNSILLVYSEKLYEEALKDSWRYNTDMWVNWDDFK